MKNEIPETFSGVDHRRIALGRRYLTGGCGNNHLTNQSWSKRNYSRRDFGQLALLLRLDIRPYTHTSFIAWCQEASAVEVRNLFASATWFKHLELANKAELSVLDRDTIRLSMIS